MAGDWFRKTVGAVFPPQVRQVFGKLGYVKGKTSISLGFGYADNNLTGNGSTDTRFLAKDYTAVNTIPDVTWNRSPSFTLNASHAFTSNFNISGAAYFRYVRADTTRTATSMTIRSPSRLYNLNAGDIAALTAAGYTGFPNGQSHHTTVSFLALYRPRPPVRRAVGKMHRRVHPNVRQTARLWCFRAG